MLLLKRILIIFFLFFPISNSWGIISDEVQNALFVDSNDAQQIVRGLAFSSDGLKVFLHYQNGGDTFRYIAEYKLSTPFDISTKTYAGDDERCELTGNSGNDRRIFDMSFSTDGLKLFIARAGSNNEAGSNIDKIFRYDLTSPYDISTCSFAQKTTDLDGDTLQLNSQAGNRANNKNNKAQGVAINNDGTKIFIIFQDAADERILEYNLSTPYDLETISLVTSAGITLPVDGNPMSLFFNSTGTRLFYHDHNNHTVTQISLGAAYDTSSFTVDGSVDIRTKASANNISSELAGLAFSKNGLMIFLANDQNDSTSDRVLQFNVSCPFNIIAGKCPPVTENSVRTGIAEAQIMIAKRTIDHSTKSALNRLQWIRRNKDNQNLSNFDINFNFNTATQLDNPLLNYWVKKLPDRILSVNEKVENGQSITIGLKDINNNKLNNFTTAIKSDNPLLNSWMDKLPETITAYQVALKKKLSKNKKSDWLYWSLGDLTIGSYHGKSVGPGINLEKPKDIRTSGLTFGADKKNSKNNYTGYAIRYADGKSKFAASGPSTTMASLTLNYYLITPLKDSGYTNTVVGLSSLKYDLKTGGVVTGQRNGKQLFTSIDFRSDSEYGKFNLTPSLKIKHALTSLSDFTEFMTNTSSAATNVIYEKETFQTGDLATGFLFNSDPVKHSTGTMSHNGGLEFVYDYSPDITFEYSYAGSSNAQQYTVEKYSQKNIRANYGYENVYNNNFTLSLNYERFQHLDSDKFSHTDSFLIKVGHISEEDTQFAFDFDPLSNNSAKLSYVKDINNFNLKLNSNMNLFTKISDYGANIEVSSKF